MAFAEEMLLHLKPLAMKLIENELYGWVSDVGDLLAAFKSGNWPKLSTEDQERYLRKMTDTFHTRAMGESVMWDDSDYRWIVERVGKELKAVQRCL